MTFSGLEISEGKYIISWWRGRTGLRASVHEQRGSTDWLRATFGTTKAEALARGHDVWDKLFINPYGPSLRAEQIIQPMTAEDLLD